MVLVLYTLCAYAGVPGIPNGASQMLLTAAGTCPPEMGRVMEMVRRRHVGRLVIVDSGRVFPSPELYAFAYMRRMADEEADSLKMEIAGLPTAPADRDMVVKGMRP